VAWSAGKTRGWLAVWCTVCSALAAWTATVPLARIPHVSDEVAYTLQARLFAAGLRAGPAGDNASMLEYPFWVAEPFSYAPFPPGWPALLSLGERVGGAWLLNSLLVAAVPVLVWALARAWADEKIARLAAVVAALSPAVWLMAGTRMSHTSALVGLGVVAVVAAHRPLRSLYWLLGGLAAAYVVVARPMDAAIVAGPLLVWGVIRAPNWASRVSWVGLPALGAAVLLWDNHTLTGSALHFPMDAWYDQWTTELGRAGCNQLGFGSNVGCAQTFGSFGHTPVKAARIIGESVLKMDGALLGLPGASLVAAYGAWRLRPRWPWIIALAVVLAHALYWSPGRAYLVRFWHPLLLILPIAVAAAMSRVPQRWAVLALSVVAVVGGSRLLPDLGDRYWCADTALEQTLAAEGIIEGVVFLRGKGHRETGWPMMGVDSFVCDPMLESGDGMRLNDPAHPDQGLRIRHALPTKAATRRYMAEHHPGATAWLVDHRVKSDKYRVLELDLE